MDDWAERIVFDVSVCHGKPCFRGTRILVAAVLDNLAAGVGESCILKEFPVLSKKDIFAALEFAADLARSPVSTDSTIFRNAIETRREHASFCECVS